MVKQFFNKPLVRILIISVLCLCFLIIAIPFLAAKCIPEAVKIQRNETNTTDKIFIPEEIDIYRTESGEVETLPFEEYIKGVVSSEMPSTFHIEALKAQAVAARTYSAARAITYSKSGNPSEHPDAPLCDTTHCQVFKNKSEIKQIKGASWMKNDYTKICKAVDETKSELLYYDGELVQQALFHSSSGGMTENCEDVFASAVPYLVSVESPYEENATHQNERMDLTIESLISKLKAAYPDINFGAVTPSNIKIISRSSGNRVEKIKVGASVLTGRQIREAIGLYSANFDINIDNGIITFTSTGSGHGVGMSQYGADGMAKEGYDYKKILSHYYSGTEIY